MLWLGKALHENNYRPFAFHAGNSSIKHWHRPDKSKLLWRFVAVHTAHNIEVMLESDMSEDVCSYQEIGDDTHADISVEDFLSHPSDYYSD